MSGKKARLRRLRTKPDEARIGYGPFNALDVKALLARMPTDFDFLRLAAPAQKAAAESAVALILDALEAKRLQPDLWHADWLRRAVVAIPPGTYVTALRFAREALTPIGMRDLGLSGNKIGTTVEELRAGLAEAGAAPLKEV